MSKVSIIIVTRNSKVFMPSVLDSILNQTYRDFQTIVIDNNSSDGTADFVRRNYLMVSVIENNKNSGFAKANNQGIRLFKSEYLVLCNPDIILETDWLEKILATAEREEYRGYSVFGGKLLKLNLLNAEVGEMEKTDIIDSCGLKVLPNHRIVEVGAGEPSLNFCAKTEVFGHGGALVLYRRESLEAIALKDKYHQDDFFDSSFFFYKEDVDLAWRFRLLGFKTLLAPEAIAYHLRTFAGSEKNGATQMVRNRRHQNHLAKYYSYRNHLLVLFEDEFLANLLIYSPQIFWLEFKKLIYVFFLEPKNLFAWLEIIKMIPEIRAKRKAVFSKAKLKAKEMREWMK